jgi:hypothetical protein
LPRDGLRRHGRADSGTGGSGLHGEAATAREAPGGRSWVGTAGL